MCLFLLVFLPFRLCLSFFLSLCLSVTLSVCLTLPPSLPPSLSLVYNKVQEPESSMKGMIFLGLVALLAFNMLYALISGILVAFEVKSSI